MAEEEVREVMEAAWVGQAQERRLGLLEREC